MLEAISGESLLTKTLGWPPLKIRGFVTNIRNEFILGLNILHAYDSSVNLVRQMLHPAEEAWGKKTSFQAWLWPVIK
jgi:hypothetical protein